MPLKPLQITKNVQTDDTRISPGAVVTYEQHSKTLLGVVLGEKAGKWLLTNQQGAEVSLPAARLALLPGKAPEGLTTANQRAAFLESLHTESQALANELDLEEVWSVLEGEVRETSPKEITEMIFNENSLAGHLAVRMALVDDTVYFKRKKTGFEPRPPETVEQLKRQVAVEKEKADRRETFLRAIVDRLKDPNAPLPGNLGFLEEIAAFGKSNEDSKETRLLLDEVIRQARVELPGRPEDKAFQLLVRLGCFRPDHNLLPFRLGRPITFSADETADAQQIAAQREAFDDARRTDFRSLLTITIDGAETRDFDDALSMERLASGYRIGIHISDVASFLSKNSPAVDAAFRRGTSVYCPDEQFPMLPPELSEKALSLVAGEPRATVSILLELDQSFEIVNRTIEPSIVQVTHRMTYDEADRLLFRESSAAGEEQYGTDLSDVRDSLTVLWEATCVSEVRRLQRGALQLNRRELTPYVLEDGRVALEDSNDDKPARKLISEMMILANETVALYGKTHRLPLIYRTQEPPDCDPEEATKHLAEGPAKEYLKRSVLKRSIISYEPAPHAGLGLDAYVQITSPIRRASDLINQRQLLSHLLEQRPRYTPQEIMELLAEIELGLEEASKIQRGRNRYWLLKYLQQEGLKELRGTVIKTDGPRPLAELELLHMLYPFHQAERRGKTSTSKPHQVGDVVRLRIDSIDPRNDTLVLREL
ncbi:MAG: RNB domain-containing ribonuclease [Bdellovibrionales bacterium]|nr:RNB domain-containing ribonuclease [Bdellovibrionales bacterium]